jgi:hypothetical protein
MHKAAHEWVFESFHEHKRELEKDMLCILEVGSLDINGSVRNIFYPWTLEYTGIDPQSGPGVDIVANGHEYSKPEAYEHTPHWKEIIARAAENLRPGGLFIATMAGETRAPHSAVHGNHPYDWEHYANIGEWELRQTLAKHFSKFETSYINPMVHGDLRCWAVK